MRQALETEKLRELLQATGGTAAPSLPGDFQKLLDEQARRAHELHARGKLTAS